GLVLHRLLLDLGLLGDLLLGGVGVLAGLGAAGVRGDPVDVLLEAVGLVFAPDVGGLVLLEHRLAGGGDRPAGLDGLQAPHRGGQHRQHRDGDGDPADEGVVLVGGVFGVLGVLVGVERGIVSHRCRSPGAAVRSAEHASARRRAVGPGLLYGDSNDRPQPQANTVPQPSAANPGGKALAGASTCAEPYFRRPCWRFPRRPTPSTWGRWRRRPTARCSAIPRTRRPSPANPSAPSGSRRPE